MSEGSVALNVYLDMEAKYLRWKSHSLGIMEELTAIEADRDIWRAKAESLAIRLKSMEADLKRLEIEVGHG